MWSQSARQEGPPQANRSSRRAPPPRNLRPPAMSTGPPPMGQVAPPLSTRSVGPPTINRTAARPVMPLSTRNAASGSFFGGGDAAATTPSASAPPIFSSASSANQTNASPPAAGPPVAGGPPVPMKARLTPPPSPGGRSHAPPKGFARPQPIVTAAPNTPLINNTGTLPSAEDAGTPTSRLSSMVRRRPLKLPPKAQISPRTNRPKFKLPPARRPRGSSFSSTSPGSKFSPGPPSSAGSGTKEEHQQPPASVSVSKPSPIPASIQQPRLDFAPAPSIQKDEPVAGTPPESSAEVTDTGAKTSDWAELSDPSTGRSYYFNSVTQETSWEKPAEMEAPAVPTPEKPSAADITATTAAVVSDTAAPATSVEETVAATAPEEVSNEPVAAEELPSGWSEVTDPSSGSVYYYNSITQETSWEKPSVQKDVPEETNDEPAAVQPEAPVVAATEENDIKPNEQPAGETKDASDLLPGWTQETDPQTGETYYFNAETKETSWEKPVARTATATPSARTVTTPSDDVAAEGDAINDTDDLPPGWTSGVDPSTGNTYYYNADTQETTWEKPVADIAAAPAAEVPTVEDSAEPASAEVGAVPETTEPEATEAQLDVTEQEQEVPGTDPAALPEGWMEVEDPSGQKYYYNSITQETSWDRPAPPPAAAAAVVQPDETTAEPQFEPDVQPPTDDAPPVEETKVDDSTEQQPQQPSVPAAEEETSDLPPGWVEREDESSGQIYYYNADTEEAQWERPTHHQEPEADAVAVADEMPPTAAADEPAEDEPDATEDAAPSNDELPDGWEELLDESSGQVYYFNQETQESNWERPQRSCAEDSPPSNEAVEQAPAAEDEEPQADVPTEQEEPAAVAATAAAAAAAEDDAAKDTDALPEGWTEELDPSTGNVYYFNELTQETSWTKPTVAEPESATAPPPVAPTAVDEPSTVPAPEPTEEQPEQTVEETTESNGLPAGWIEVADESTGQVYYFNETTQETQWDKPAVEGPRLAEPDATDIPPPTEAAVEEEQPPAVEEIAEEEHDETPVPAPPLAEAPVSDGWTMVEDPNSGSVYYFNEITQETSWEPPPQEASEGAESQGEGDVQPEAAEATDQPTMPATEPEPETAVDAVAEAETEAKDESTTPATATTALPVGWVEVPDPATGSVYYFNEATQETRWDVPEIEESVHVEQEPEPVPTESVEQETTPTSAEGEAGNEPASKLPEGWVEVPDPATGSVYYFNEATQETRWDVPEIEESVHVEQEQEPIPTEPVEETTTPTSAEGETGTEPASKLPEGWVEVPDPATGSVYYFNEATQETSWEIPPSQTQAQNESEVQEEVAEPVGDVAGDAAPSDLPEGWTMLTDPDSGKTYYYNEGTMESSWEFPEATEKAQPSETGEPDSQDGPEATVDVADEPVTATEAADEPEPQGTQDDDIAAAAAATTADAHDGNHLPDGWMEVVDESSGQVYYYNASTEETSWEKPATDVSESSAPSAAAASEGEEEEMAVDQPIAPIAQEGAEDAPPTEDKLPDGWILLTDPDSGIQYYYNEVMQETSWELPQMEVSAQADANDDAGEGAPELTDEAPAPQEVVDPNQTDEPDIVVDASNEGPKQNEANGAQNPDEWVEMTDPSTGNKYYFNTQTEEVSWDNPNQQQAASEEVSSAVKPEAEAEAESSPPVEGSDEAEPEAEPKDELPEGWTEQVDPSSNQVYYFNEITQETSWERPVAADGDDVQQEPEQVADPAPEVQQPQPEDATEEVEADGSPQSALPAGWVEVADEATGQVYYYNEVTQETRWDKPETQGQDMIGSPPAAADGGDATHSASAAPTAEEPTEEPPKVEADAAVDAEPLVEPDATEGAQLPEGWTIVEDPDSGNVYYFNELTQETSWDPPTQEGGAEPEAPVDDGAQVGAVEAEADAPPSTTEAEAETEPPSDAVLPAGWVEVTDPNSGSVYYYNEETQETSWEKPAAQPVSGDTEDEQPAAASDVGQAAPETSEAAPPTQVEDSPVKPMDTSLISLPEGWLEEIDPTTGQVYFFNNITQETTWERPNGAAEATGPEPQPQPQPQPQQLDEKTDEVVAEAAPAIEKSLPPTSQAPPAPKPAAPVPAAIPTSMSTVPTGESLEGMIERHESEKKHHDVIGSMVASPDPKTFSFIKNKAQNADDLLWRLVYIAVKYKGRLRSDEGAENKRSPEAAIVKLLLTSDEKQSTPKITATNKSGDTNGNHEADGNANEKALQDVQELVVQGRRSEAAKQALAAGDFATALLVSSMSDHVTFREAAKQYIEHSFASGSPLYTVSMLFYGDLAPPPSRAAGSMNWGGSAEDLRSHWRQHLASILTNRTSGWELIVQSFGDRLEQLGETKAAHFCFMVSNSSISNPTDPLCRVALLGCSHKPQSNLELQTDEALEAYERTEAYEWAKRLGNRKAAIQSLQCFKIVYARHLMQFGRQMEAQALVQSIRKCVNPKVINAAAASKSGAPSSTPAPTMEVFKDTGAFASALVDLEKTLGVAAKTAPKPTPKGKKERKPSKSGSNKSSSSNNNNNQKPATSSVKATKPTKPMQPSRVSADAKPALVVSALPGQAKQPPMQVQAAPPAQPIQPPMPRSNQTGAGGNQNEENPADVSFVTAKTNLMDRSGYSLETPERKSREMKPPSSTSRPTPGRKGPPTMAGPVAAPAAAATIGGDSVPPVANVPFMKPPTMSNNKVSAPSPSRSRKGRQPPQAAAKPLPMMNVAAVPSPGAGVAAALPAAKAATAPPVMGMGKPASVPPSPSMPGKKGPPAPIDTSKSSTPAPRPKAAPATAPANLDGNKSVSTPTTKPSPASGGSGGLFSRFRGTMVKLLNPDAHQVTLEEESEKAYYDEKRKVWVFPGEDPDVVAKPVGPPPMGGAAAPQTAPAAPSNDPLAAMMAPPSRAPSALRGRGAPRRPASLPGTPAGMMPPPAMGGSAGGNAKRGAAPPPKFAVFKPKKDVGSK